jgi:uncharacterized protein YcgL (UPF0745 family)
MGYNKYTKERKDKNKYYITKVPSFAQVPDHFLSNIGISILILYVCHKKKDHI